MSEELDTESIKRAAKKIEQWFLRNLGGEDVTSSDPYLQDLKRGLELCRRFILIVDSNKPDLDSLNEIATALDEYNYSHGWIDLRGLVNQWKNKIPQSNSEQRRT